MPSAIKSLLSKINRRTAGKKGIKFGIRKEKGKYTVLEIDVERRDVLSKSRLLTEKQLEIYLDGIYHALKIK